MAGGLVGGHQAAQADVVARGVLDAGQHAVGPQAHEHVRRRPGAAQAHGHVVGEQRHVHARPDGPEVVLDLGRVVEGVEGAGGHDGVGAGGRGAPGLLDDAGRGGVDGPRQDGHPPVGAGHGAGHDGLAPGVGEVGGLAGGAQEEQAVDAGADEHVDEAVEAVEVDAPVQEGGDDRGDDACEAGVHVCSFYGVVGCGRRRAPVRSPAGWARRPGGCACSPAAGGRRSPRSGPSRGSGPGT